MQFSIVTAVYNVSRYLDDFIASIEAQMLPRDRFEVIAVDDGSTDDSLSRLEGWAARSDVTVRVLTKENGGQGSARNLGMEQAQGDWVGFVDPDDLIEPEYLENAAAFLELHPDTDMLGTHRLMLDDETGEVTNTHPLRSFFRDGDVLRDLTVDTDFFHGSAPAAFYRRDLIGPAGVSFSLGVRPNFEDGHFSCRYLLQLERPRVGFLQGSRYHYRKRQDSSSTLQTSLTDKRRYTDVLRLGYLDALTVGKQKYGRPPVWLQNFVVYELMYYFSAHDRTGGAAGAHDEVADEFHALMAQITALLDHEVVEKFELGRMTYPWRLTLMHGYAGEAWTEDFATVTAVDDHQKLVQLTYHFTGELPEEEFEVGGELVQPKHAKVRDFIFNERVLLEQRIVWLSSRGSIRVRLGGRPVGLRLERPVPGKPALRPQMLSRMSRASQLTTEQLALLTRGQSPPTAKKYQDAWVLMDRIHDADDSGEHLFRWIREHEPDVNAWFVLEQGAPDWKRLKKAGYGRRLVAFGSEEWKLLMLNARHLVSSHADEAIVHPPALSFVEPGWRFTFLQHGVIKDDLSRWLRRKPIQVFVTSTPDEYASVAGDHTTYHYTTKETVLTGLPRFDLVREAGRIVPTEKRDLLLVAPTWRRWLVKPLDEGTQRRIDAGDAFLESDFVAQWRAFLSSPDLEAACDRHGLTLAFLPHPNLQPALPKLELAGHVQAARFEGTDIRALVARAALLVTDFSSMAFNAAYIDRPVLYFQFDADRVLGGEHVGRAGYFDYGRDGFGPVVRTVSEAVRESCQILDAGRSPAAPYSERIAATFPDRDGKCRERTFRAIAASRRALSREAAADPVPTPPGPDTPLGRASR